MEMKTTRVSIVSLAALLLAAPTLYGQAQQLSKYRVFSIGTNLATVLKHTDQRSAEVKTNSVRPAQLQQLTWWPPSLPGASFRADSVEQILFSFYNGELYKISVSYDRTSTQGLTVEDMLKSITARYGPATSIVPQNNSETKDWYEVTQKPVASWEDSETSFNLVRSSFTDGFELVIYSKRANAKAELAATEALKLDEREGPQREADRQKKETDDLEVAREKNQKSFRP
jgi:hypothetical protein